VPRGGRPRPRRGVITGHLVQLCRVSAGITQEDLARYLGVSPTTMQAWETGRRSITSASHGDATALAHRLINLGARGELVASLGPAVDADLLLGALLDLPSESVELEEHPLGWTVLEHAVVEMLLWALAGHPPRVCLDGPSPARRGPAAGRPELDPGEDRTVFANLRILADRASGRLPLLHRQAVFIASADPRQSARAWARPSPEVLEHFLRPVGWTPHWAGARSHAIALARGGDSEPLSAFIRNADDAWEIANLQYWAYWCGDLQGRRAADEFMADSVLRWRGTRLFDHLTRRLDPSSSRTELNIHTLWSLLQVRPGLPADDPVATARLLTQAEPLLDSGALSARASDELRSVRYALTIQGHTTKEAPQ
jgi:transcriptional regulator with XRE-family HTH domain